MLELRSPFADAAQTSFLGFSENLLSGRVLSVANAQLFFEGEAIKVANHTQKTTSICEFIPSHLAVCKRIRERLGFGLLWSGCGRRQNEVEFVIWNEEDEVNIDNTLSLIVMKYTFTVVC